MYCIKSLFYTKHTLQPSLLQPHPFILDSMPTSIHVIHDVSGIKFKWKCPITRMHSKSNAGEREIPSLNVLYQVPVLHKTYTPTPPLHPGQYAYIKCIMYIWYTSQWKCPIIHGKSNAGMNWQKYWPLRLSIIGRYQIKCMYRPWPTRSIDLAQSNNMNFLWSSIENKHYTHIDLHVFAVSLSIQSCWPLDSHKFTNLWVWPNMWS